jgi:GT2 family glycosyltransferase
MASRTTVIIVNWNGAEYLERLLRSLEDASPHSVIVVDNASSDSSQEILLRFPNVETIRNQQNLGFGFAANQGIALAKTNYLLLLNADVEVMSGTLSLLECFLDENQTAAIVAPQLLFADGSLQPSCRPFPTTARLFLYFSYLDHLIPWKYRPGKEFHQTTSEVDQPMGAAMMIRKSALDEVGTFDERFFLYMEDVDLCERIKKQGWKIFYLPAAKIIHYAGGSSRKDWERSQSNLFESTMRYFNKRYGRFRMIVLRFLLFVALLIRSLVLIFGGRIGQAVSYLKLSSKILWLQ